MRPQDTFRGDQPRDHLAQERRIFRRVMTWGGLAFLLVLVLVPSNFNPIFRLSNHPSSSMAPGLPEGSISVVSRIAYGWSRFSYDWFALPITGRWPAILPRRGDVIVFRLPSDPSTVYIKRVVGLPGDSVQIVNGRLVLNGKTITREPALPASGGAAQGEDQPPTYVERLADGTAYPILETSGDSGPNDNTPVINVPPGHLFLLGDNRDNSNDSRVPAAMGGIGLVPVDMVVGKVLWSFALPKEMK